MIRSRAELYSAVRLLLESERQITVLPAAARARALSRAQAALAAGVATRPVPSRAPWAARWAAAGLAGAATVAAGAGLYRIGVRAWSPAPPVAASLEPPAPADVPTPLSGPRTSAFVNPPAEPMRVPTPTPSVAGTARAELRLLEQARAAGAREDFVLAIELLDQHARRFRMGRLAEEREALRVRALVGLGRHDEARRAAAEFEAYFPLSPLALAISRMADAVP
jgi:hypothetical protein